jgi:hypothetical protein
MVHAWNEGMASVRSVKPNPALMGLTRDIEAPLHPFEGRR